MGMVEDVAGAERGHLQGAGVGPEQPDGCGPHDACGDPHGTSGDGGACAMHGVNFDVCEMPRRVWVDTDVCLTFRAACEHGCDLAGGSLVIVDERGAQVARVVLGPSVDGVSTSEPATVPMPHEPGEHVWSVNYAPAPDEAPAGEASDAAPAEGDSPAEGRDGGAGDAAAAPDAAPRACHEASSFELVLSPEPHTTSMSVWDVPSPAVAGTRACISVGVTCPAGCELAGQDVVVLDEDGAEVARGRLAEKASGTGDLWHATVDVALPEVCGLHHWKARYAGDGAHPSSERAFSFAVVAEEPTCSVTVHVEAQFGEGCLAHANVTLREPGNPPYRGLTADDGTCVVVVPAGTYNVSAACPGYKSVTMEGVEVGPEGSDVTLTLPFAPEY